MQVNYSVIQKNKFPMHIISLSYVLQRIQNDQEDYHQNRAVSALRVCNFGFFVQKIRGVFMLSVDSK